MPPKATIREIARLCGVSKTTVSAAIRGGPGVSEPLRKKIQTVANQMGYICDSKVSQVMAHIASSNSSAKLRRLAIVGAPELPTPPPWAENGLLHRFYKGVKQRSEQLGCGFESFWMAEPGMTNRRLAQILYARGIDGIVLLLDYGKNPTTIEFEYEKFAVSAIGRSLRWPHLYAAEGDLHQGMLLALERAENYGYERPGLLIRQAESRRASHSWEAAYYFGQNQLPLESRIPVCLFTSADTSMIPDWFAQHSPDVIIGHQPPAMARPGFRDSRHRHPAGNNRGNGGGPSCQATATQHAGTSRKSGDRAHQLRVARREDTAIQSSTELGTCLTPI